MKYKLSLVTLALASMVSINTINAKMYHYTDDQTPLSMGQKDMQVTIENKTGKKIDMMRVTFRFIGENDISRSHADRDGYTFGHIKLKDIPADTTATALASEAIKHGVDGKVIDHFSKLNKILVLRIDSRMLSHRVFKMGTEENYFIITMGGRVRYRIETKKEYNERMAQENRGDKGKTKKTTRKATKVTKTENQDD